LGSRKLRASEIFPTVGSAAGERATEAEVMKRRRRPAIGTINLQSGNNPGNTIIGQVPAGSCTNVVSNSQPGGTSRGTPITTDITFNP